jgi:hypothetical protein
MAAASIIILLIPAVIFLSLKPAFFAPADFQLGSEQDRREEARIKASCQFYSAVP